MRARWLIAACLVLALLFGAVWVVPSLLDWNRYRDDIAALAARGIGRPVQIAGDVRLSLLPQPVLTAARLTVADTGDGVTLTARELRLRVSLSALLGGRVDARELVLRGADLRLPWPPAPGALSQRPPAWLSGLQARVETGRLQVGGIAFTDIEANLATDSDTGSLSATGRGKFDAQAWRFTGRLSQPGRDGSAALDASLDGDGPLRDTGGAFSGQLGADGALSGRATGRGPNLSLLLPAPALPWRGEGRLTAAGGLAIADELQIDLAGVPARGAVALRVAPEARLDVAITSNRLDLDAWWPVLLRGAAPSMPTGVDLSAEAASFAGGQLRRVRAGLDLGPEGAVLREASAELPGEAALTLTGTASRQGGFSGQARIGAPDLRTTLHWLEPSVPGLAAMMPAEALRTADLSAAVTAENGLVSLADLHGMLDGSAVSGVASVRPGTRPAVTGRLVLNRLVLDPWLPDPDPDRLRALAHRFDAFDADLRIEARQATWRGLPVVSAVLDAQAEGGRLMVRRLEATVRGVRVALSGSLGEAGRLSDGKLDISTDDAAPIAALVPPSWRMLAPLLRGPATLNVQGAGGPEALALRIQAAASDLRLDARPVLNLGAGKLEGSLALQHPGAPRLLAQLGLNAAASWIGDGSFSLLSQVAVAPGEVRVDSFDLAAGALRTGGQLGVGFGDMVSVAGRVTAESLPWPGSLAQTEPLPTALLRGWRAAVRMEARQVLVNGAPAIGQASANVSLTDGVLTLDHGTGTLAGGPMNFALSVDGMAEPPRFGLKGAVSGIAITQPVLAMVTGPAPVDLISGEADLRVDLSAAGHGAAAVLATLAGEVQATVRGGVLQGLDLARASAAIAPGVPMANVLDAIRSALTGGQGAFAMLDVTAHVANGVASLVGGTLTDRAGTASVSGSADVPGGSLDLRLERPATDQTPSFAVRVTGPVRQAIRAPELSGLARALAEAAP